MQAVANGTWAGDDHLASAVVVRLVVDTWLSAGPVAAFPLVLLVLRRTYFAHHPHTRQRAFDLIANLQVQHEIYPLPE
jgi:hypothetical protein